MTVLVAAISGIGAFLVVNTFLGIVRAIASGSIPAIGVILHFSPLALPIRCAGWFAAVWAGLSVFDAMGGM